MANNRPRISPRQAEQLERLAKDLERIQSGICSVELLAPSIHRHALELRIASEEEDALPDV